jgi:hypothetical protein
MAHGKAEARYLGLLLYTLGLILRSFRLHDQPYRMEYHNVHVGVRGFLYFDFPVKRSSCGARTLEHLGSVVFSIWTTLATSLLEAGSCGSVDTENGLIARGASWRCR